MSKNSKKIVQTNFQLKTNFNYNFNNKAWDLKKSFPE